MPNNTIFKFAKLKTYTYVVQSPMGQLLMAADGEALTGLWFESQKYFPESFGTDGDAGTLLPVFEETIQWLDLYFKGQQPHFTPKLNLKGTPFRQRIWEMLLEIPYGEVVTYQHLAHRYAQEQGLKQMSAQAVGGAVGHNPVSIIVPCHRVVGTNGSLTGYAGGLDKKATLLALEGCIVSSTAKTQ